MMKTVLGLGVLAIGVGGLALFLLFAGDSPSSEVVGTESERVPVTDQVKTVEPIAGQGSLESLLALAQDLECTISYTPVGETAPVVGTYFTTSGMMRGDFEVPGLDAGTVSSLVVRDNALYTWSTIQGQVYGMKIDLAAAAASASTTPDTHEPVPFDAPVDYECKAWPVVDKSIFELPGDVLFKDFSTVVGGGMEYGTIYEESAVPATSPCDLCNQVSPGPGQDECRARFACQ